MNLFFRMSSFRSVLRSVKKRSGQIIGSRGFQGLFGDDPPLGPQGINPLGETGDIGNPGPTCACRLDTNIPEISPTGPFINNDFLQYNISNLKWQPSQEANINQIDFTNIPQFPEGSTGLEYLLGFGKLYRTIEDPTIIRVTPILRIVTDQLEIHYRAGAVEGTTITNLANPGTYDGIINPGTQGGGGVINPGFTGAHENYLQFENDGLRNVAGADTYIRIGDGYLLKGGVNTILTNCTLEFWYYATDGDESSINMFLYNEYPASPSGVVWRHAIAHQGGGVLSRDSRPSSTGGVDQATVPNPVNGVSDPTYGTSAGKPRQIVFTYGDTDLSIYVNGVSVDVSKQVTPSDTYTGTEITQAIIGARISASNLHDGFSGGMSVIRIYDRELTQEEVIQNYNAEQHPSIK